MYYIIELGSERTLAMTKDENIAKLIASNMKTICTIRWSWG